MKIWYVDTDMENSCAWSTKEKAINYFKKECQECEWAWLLRNGNENDSESCLTYFIVTKEGSTFYINIYSILLDESPIV